MSPLPEADAIAGTPGAPAERARAIVRAALREPLVHFLVAGAVIFAAALAVKGSERPVVVIDARDLSQLAAYWQAQMQRPPTPEELRGIVRDRVDEEILASEAVRLGYDKDDIIIRRRLAQKMAFAGEDAAPVREPDEATLRAFYEKTKSRYAAPAQMALRHVFFSADNAGARQAAERALAAAQVGEAPAGDPSMLPTSYADVSGAELTRDFGPAFARLAEATPVGAWAGPVQSSFGWHILEVETRRPALIESFERARSEVREAWMAERRAAASAAYMEKLRRRYRVEVAHGMTGPLEAPPLPD